MKEQGIKTEEKPVIAHYNRIAGQNLDRIAALSDGIFAVAATLLVLNLHIPDTANIASDLDLWQALVKLGPGLLTYLMSFLTLGIFWVGQQTQLNHFNQSDHHLTWIHLAFLLVVVLMPFSTSLLASFITLRLALVVYWLNILLLGVLLLASLQYAKYTGLVKEEAAINIYRAGIRRIIVAQALYAFGALLCIIDTRLSIGFIVLVQLNYAIAPQIRFLSRL
jgi:uncharacterized membrane protein